MRATNLDKAKIAIIDYGMGNLFSIQRACAYAGLEGIVTSDKKIIGDSSGLILPGVGAFGDAMYNLRKLDLDGIIKDQIGLGKPFFGICLGMQLLFTESEEFGGHKGLNVVKGVVVRFQNKGDGGHFGKVKIPQVGWNQIYFKNNADLLSGVKNGEYMYFVHSYYPLPEDAQVALTTTSYGHVEYCSSCLKDSVFATQFHPEKSGLEGLKLYQNWAQKVHRYEGIAVG